ncbi:BTAD domain-containing putative transcriptional regulator [Jatrophihabitans fulvus]
MAPGGTLRPPPLRRTRVTRVLDVLSDRRLVAVVADGGSGKTAAVHDWLADAAVPTAWLTIGAEHGDPPRLLADLVAVTSAHCPGLAAYLDRELALPPAADEPAAAETSAVALAEALAAAWSETAGGAPAFRLVLDDLHLLDGTPSALFLADLVRLYPRSVQLVVASRTTPPFAVERLRGVGEYGELGGRTLLFDADETAALFACFGAPVDLATAEAVTRAGAGWATAVRLAVEWALTHGVERLPGQLASPAAASERLTTAVLDPLPPGVRRVLRGLSVLGTAPRAAVDDRAGEVADLDALAERGLLVTSDGTNYSLTALAKFAVDQADPVDAGGRRDVLRRAVEGATEAGLAEAAVQWAVQLGEPGAVADTVARFGTELLDRRLVAPLLAAAELLREPAGDPRIDALFAQLFAQRGGIQRALEHLGRLDPSAPLSAAVAWRVASALWLQGESAHSEAVLARAAGGPVEGPAEGPSVDRDADRALVEACRATVAWGHGDGAAGRTRADAALALARRAGDDTALASAWVAQALVAVLDGDLERNRQAYTHALRHARAAGDLRTEVRILCNVGSQHNETGRYREALGGLDEAVRLGEITGQTALVALARANQADARLGSGQIEQALQAVEDALATWTAMASPMAAHAYQGRGDALARRGDPTRAAAAYRQAVALGERFDDAQVLVPALAGLARVELAEDPEEARALAERAVAMPAAVGSLPAYLAAGWVALATGDRDTAAEWARRTSAEAARRDAPAQLAEARLLAVLADPSAGPGDGRLAEAAQIWAELGNPLGAGEVQLATAVLAGDARAAAAVRATLRGLGVRDSAVRIAGPLAVLGEERAATVAVQTLGTFQVFRGGTAVPPSAWQSRKARDLVKILASRRGRAISRESVAALLWPDSPATGNKLSVALSTARSVFDPDREFPPDRFVNADRGSVRLDLRSVELDIEAFTDRADVALTAAENGHDTATTLLEAAIAAYPGDFCEEDPYEPWAEQTRDELRARHHHVLRTLAQHLAAGPRPDTAVPWLITLLGVDPYDEPTHLRLVRTLVRSGRHGEARRAYRTYTERMADIDVEPAAFPQPPRHRHARVG